jgi:hypothetical protein
VRTTNPDVGPNAGKGFYATAQFNEWPKLATRKRDRLGKLQHRADDDFRTWMNHNNDWFDLCQTPRMIGA